MKRISILCAAVLVTGTYTPAMAINTSDPGFYRKCAVAYIKDPATYDRDCAANMKSLMDNSVGPATVAAPVVCGSIDTKRFPLGARFKVAAYDPCHQPT